MNKIDAGHVIITFICKDKPGLVNKITSIIANFGINIIDIDQSVTRGVFSIILMCDLTTSSLEHEKCISNLKEELELLREQFDAYFLLDEGKLDYLNRNAPEKYVKITILGKDSPGIVAKVSEIIIKYGYNIENIGMISRKDIFAMEVLMSIPRNIESTNFPNFKQDLKKSIDMDKLSIIIQENNIFSEEKKLVVFDMDSTLIREECIDQMGNYFNIKDKISEITKRAMEGKIEFTEAIKERVRLLKGIPESFLQEIANNLTLTPGATELITSIKKMGYKVALISGGFSFFTNVLKEKLDLDYAFGNELIVKDGRLTGEINENFIVDATQKAKIQSWLAKIEKIPQHNIVCIGDGANDTIMIANSGIGIGFQPKKIVKNVADGIINEDNLLGIMFALGDLRKKKYNMEE